MNVTNKNHNQKISKKTSTATEIYDKRTHYATVERVANWSGTFGLSGTNSDTMKMANILFPMVVGVWLFAASQPFLWQLF